MSLDEIILPLIRQKYPAGDSTPLFQLVFHVESPAVSTYSKITLNVL
jgi:hypothetical protein